MSFASASENRLPREQRIASGSHVVDTQNIGPLSRQCETDAECPGIAFFDLSAEDSLQESLSRMADEHRSTKCMKIGDV